MTRANTSEAVAHLIKFRTFLRTTQLAVPKLDFDPIQYYRRHGLSMLLSHEQAITQLLPDAVGSLLSEGQVRPGTALGRPKQAAYGDIACSVMLQLAKPLGVSPRKLVGKIADVVRANARGQRLMATVEIADPGFINLRLSVATCAGVVAVVFAEGDRCDVANTYDDAPMLVELVSTSLTGLLHVGHGRQATLDGVLVSSFG